MNRLLAACTISISLSLMVSVPVSASGGGHYHGRAWNGYSVAPPQPYQPMPGYSYQPQVQPPPGYAPGYYADRSYGGGYYAQPGYGYPRHRPHFRRYEPHGAGIPGYRIGTPFGPWAYGSSGHHGHRLHH
jgi:hypothetical protein